ncbi:hypothetical protein SAMN05444354_114138 [Stigmatella aurantiaca]|uniref:Uncharacterized protein n=1 Tax=Stigmatella aurantiaca TaxID=41 RepID=A0A1H7X9S4_STIAU|nr:hypothetical protein [Stigmatella aurantiaca]SEM29927.1 hypothetical protein SAMN05444354_114138 [Stigmatella aurantiaca]
MKMPRRIFIGLSIIALALMAVVVPYCGRWWRIDACLDAGGAWDEPSGTCVVRQPVTP